jgi:hypothetical protein
VQGFVRWVDVVAPAPALDVELRVEEREKPMLIQALVVPPAVEAFERLCATVMPVTNSSQLVKSGR